MCTWQIVQNLSNNKVSLSKNILHYFRILIVVISQCKSILEKVVNDIKTLNTKHRLMKYTEKQQTHLWEFFFYRVHEFGLGS